MATMPVLDISHVPTSVVLEMATYLKIRSDALQSRMELDLQRHHRHQLKDRRRGLASDPTRKHEARWYLKNIYGKNDQARSEDCSPYLEQQRNHEHIAFMLKEGLIEELESRGIGAVEQRFDGFHGHDKTPLIPAFEKMLDTATEV